MWGIDAPYIGGDWETARKALLAAFLAGRNGLRLPASWEHQNGYQSGECTAKDHH